MSTDLRAGDRVTWTGLRDAPGTVIEYGRPTRVKFDGDAQVHNLPVDELRHVPVTAEHVGQWARGAGIDTGMTRRGVICLANPTRVSVRDDAGLSWTVERETAVLVAAPSPEPSPAPAFPFVGARAQVTVAEWDDGTPSRLSAGDVGTLTGQTHDSIDWIVQRGDGRYGYVAARHLRPVPADQPGEHEDWRVEGGKVIGRGLGWEAVRLMGDPDSAARAVTDHQDAPALRAEVQRLTEQVERYRGAVADMNLVAAEYRDERNEARRQRDKAQAERHAARAELAAVRAQGTDGLGLPEIAVERHAGYITAVHPEDGEWFDASHNLPTRILRGNAAAALALLRARLADEATADA